MFWPDIVTYRRFYGSRLGRLTRRQIRNRLRNIWPDVKGQTVMSLGYGVPLLRIFNDEARLVIQCMPDMQGGIQWPDTGHNRTLLTDECELPLPDKSVNCVLLMHILEHTDSPRMVMKEVWRVLAPGGRVLAVVPSRSGLWTRSDSTPLGYGRPYSLSQLRELMDDAGFTTGEEGTMLFFPPSHSRLMLRAAPWLERIGTLLLPWFGGLLWMEAQKQVLAILPKDGEPARKKRSLNPVAEPVLGMRAYASPSGRGNET